MNRNGFIAAVAECSRLKKLRLPKGTVAAVIDATLESIRNALKAGDEIRFVGFGNFFVSERPAVKGRNPRTGEEIQIKASRIPRFRAGKPLKEAIMSASRRK